jgi:hypothetical protein
MFGGALAALAEFGESWSSYLESEAEGAQQHGEAEDEDGVEGSGRGEIDQIVAFFEREYDGREDSFRPFFDTADDVARLHELRVQYFNLTTRIDHNDEQIAFQLEELREKRAAFRRLLLDAPSTQRLGRLTAQAVMEVQEQPATKALTASISVLKLDINDRKNTRFFKERERQEAVAPLSKMITEIKLRELDRSIRAAPSDDASVGCRAPWVGGHDVGLAKRNEDCGREDAGGDGGEGERERTGGAVGGRAGFISGGAIGEPYPSVCTRASPSLTTRAWVCRERTSATQASHRR